MKFYQGGVYTHRKLEDTKIYVRKVMETTYGIHLGVIWFTAQGSMLSEDDIVIKPDYVSDWREVKDHA